MKGNKKILICALALLIGFALWFCQEPREDGTVSASAIGKIKVSGGYLNVRTGPGKNYGVVKSGGTTVTVSDGTTVTVTGKNGSWYHIKFKQNNKNVTGYVMKNYVKVQTGKVATTVYGLVSSKTSLRSTTSTTGAVTTVKGKKVSLKQGRKLRILSEKMVGNTKWYRVSLTVSSQKVKGYILSKRVNLTCGKGLPLVVKTTKKKIALYTAPGGKKKVYSGGGAVALKNKNQATLLGQKWTGGKKYLRLRLSYKKNTVYGYIQDKYGFLQIVAKEGDSNTVTPSSTPINSDVAGLTDAEFQDRLEKEGFPATYVSRLVALHRNYPNWDYKAYKTGLDWDEVIRAESKVGLNLVPNSKSYDWKSTAAGAYNWSKDKYTVFDGTTWVAASEKAVKYYMDPRNFMDERGIFQFENLAYQKGIHTQTGVENILKNTPMYNKTYKYTSSGKQVSEKYSKTFITAASSSGVSPYHLASRVKQEVVISSTQMSSSVSGNVAGYKGIYNFYNIGASDSAGGGAIAKGLKWASSGSTYSRPWNSPHKSIVGGASYIGKNYINKGQNTLYLQKFNVTPNGRYTHQYMTNVEAPNSEATKVKNAYGDGKKDIPLVFSIPVYNNMPDQVCEVPTGGKNPNNFLKSLTANAGTWGTKFTLGDDGSKTYTLTVANSVTSVKLTATAVAATSTVTGAGTKSGLKVGTTTYTIKVKSESGVTRNYKVQITRKSA